MHSDDGRVIRQSWRGLGEQLDFQYKRVGSHGEVVNDCLHVLGVVSIREVSDLGISS